MRENKFVRRASDSIVIFKNPVYSKSRSAEDLNVQVVLDLFVRYKTFLHAPFENPINFAIYIENHEHKTKFDLINTMFLDHMKNESLKYNYIFAITGRLGWQLGKIEFSKERLVQVLRRYPKFTADLFKHAKNFEYVANQYLMRDLVKFLRDATNFNFLVKMFTEEKIMNLYACQDFLNQAQAAMSGEQFCGWEKLLKDNSLTEPEKIKKHENFIALHPEVSSFLQCQIAILAKLSKRCTSIEEMALPMRSKAVFFPPCRTAAKEEQAVLPDYSRYCQFG